MERELMATKDPRKGSTGNLTLRQDLTKLHTFRE